MAKLPVGYSSPFKKSSPMKIAPWLAMAGKWAVSPAGQARRKRCLYEHAV